MRFQNKRDREVYQAAVNSSAGVLVGYLVAGDPTPHDSLDWLAEAVDAGIDILEIGVPSRNPYVDGEIIKRGHQRAHENGDPSEWLLPFWRDLRSRTTVPLWAMGYKTDVVDSGLYLELAKEGLIDALVLPDCPLAEQNQICVEMEPYGVDVVRFVNPAMSDEELQAAVSQSAVIYAQMYAGTTGDPLSQFGDLDGLLVRTRQLFDGMIVAGFGLRSPEKVAQVMKSGYDGAVVGSALVARCEFQERDYLYRLISEMKLGTCRAQEGEKPDEQGLCSLN
ncbi:tryptophan synthase subunit alpha [Brevibacillus fluminis]|uniref:tryptophan synthase subunit alpha n=1 Tax=Brevibacillus fluminis TaxID=511487 RepID=UPI003F8AFDB1